MKQETLLENLDKIHTTEMGIDRIKKNLDLNTLEVVKWCKDKIKDNSKITRIGKNWYVEKDNIIFTINAFSYTIITAHKKRNTR